MGIRKKVIISGFAEMTPQRGAGGKTPLGIMAEMSRLAIADAGLTKSRIDGLLTGQTMGDGFTMLWPSVVAEHLGLEPRYMNTVENGGGSTAGMIWRAAAAIEAGMCNHVLITLGDVWDSKTMQFNPPPLPKTGKEFDDPYGLTGPIPGYALFTRRHMHEFGTTPEQLAKVAVDQRTNAVANPAALYGGKSITIDDVLGSKVLCEPLHILEVVSPCTGGCAFVVSRADYAADCPNTPVYLLGAGEAGGHRSTAYATHSPEFTTSLAKRSAADAFAMAGVRPGEMDFYQLYDCFTVVVITQLEDIGVCAKGEGGAFVGATDLTWRGPCPVNTHGGQLSFGQPGLAGGATQVIEGIRQLMGRGGERQVKDAVIGYVGNGGVIGQASSVVLSNDATA